MTLNTEAMSENVYTDHLSTNDSDVGLITLTEREQQSTDTATIKHGCGFGSCKPKWMQSLANVKLFTIITCVLACVNGAISASYLPSVITTIERRFEFGSSVTGLVVASYEVGATIAVIFVSYLGNQRHIPVIIGCGTILVGFGTCLFALPHFLSSPYSLKLTEEANRTSEDTCLNAATHDGSQRAGYCAPDEFESSVNDVYVAIFVIAQSLIGIGSTPILTLGLSYIDNHVTKKKSPQYLAFVYAAATLGPVLGFGCGAVFMEVYVDFMTPSFVKLALTSTDSQWVGAWWVGFLIFGALNLLVAPPFFAFPKKLPQPVDHGTYDVATEAAERLNVELEVEERNGNASLGELQREDGDDPDQGERASLAEQMSAESKCSSIKEFPRAVMKLLKNPVYMLLNLASVFEMVIVTGFITFVPKYLETQFGLRTSQANLYTGSLAIPGAALGIISSGMVLKKLKLTMRGTLQFTVILSVLSLACFSLAFLFGCDNLKIAGVTVPYHKSRDPVSKVSMLPQNLTSGCNSDCVCQSSVYSPVCGGNSITYFSACHAGCRLSPNGTIEDCDCVDTMLSSTTSASSLPLFPDIGTTTTQVLAGQATTGACKGDCQMLIPFMLLLLVICFLMAGLKTPIATVTMRCVEDDLRSFSLGIQMVILRTLALLPAPIIFGNIIDTTCLWWKYECGSRKNCLLYDVESYRYKYAGICTGLHLLGLMTFVITWYIVRKQEKRELLQQRHDINKPVEAKARFYMNEEGECSLQSLTGTEITTVGPPTPT